MCVHVFGLGIEMMEILTDLKWKWGNENIGSLPSYNTNNNVLIENNGVVSKCVSTTFRSMSQSMSEYLYNRYSSDITEWKRKPLRFALMLVPLETVHQQTGAWRDIIWKCLLSNRELALSIFASFLWIDVNFSRSHVDTDTLNGCYGYSFVMTLRQESHGNTLEFSLKYDWANWAN